MKGHQILPAADLSSALKTLDNPFDLLISDIELPDGSGLDLMRQLRGRVPGIAISGFGAPDDIQMSLDAGFTLHLTKPVEVRHLDEAIAAVLAQR
jgi:DNA-binding response OmpR family regulator